MQWELFNSASEKNASCRAEKDQFFNQGLTVRRGVILKQKWPLFLDSINNDLVSEGFPSGLSRQNTV
jgi:hypothetical protein